MKEGQIVGHKENLGRLIDKACRGSEVPLRAFWPKASKSSIRSASFVEDAWHGSSGAYGLLSGMSLSRVRQKSHTKILHPRKLEFNCITDLCGF